jgi:hypothetical protein
MNDIHTFILQHVMAWLPGLWDYSRPADLLVVFLGMVAFVVFIRLVVKLLPVLLLAGVILFGVHALPRLHLADVGLRRELGFRGGEMGR